MIEPVKATGQKHLVDSCPYGAIWWNEEKQVPQHWNFDAHLIDSGWAEPRCVQSCPTGALRSVRITDSEMEKLKSDQELEQLEPEFQTKPRVHYKNLHLYKKCFIGGTVVITNSGLEDCLEGAIAVLNKDGKKIGEEISDAFGEFKFDNLEPAGGAHRIDILHPEYTSLSVNVELRESIYTGVHVLTPR